MFKTLEKTLEKPLTDLELKKFSHLITSSTDIIKLNIDQVSNKNLTAYYLEGQDDDSVKAQVEKFISNWFSKSVTENRKEDVHTVNVISPPFEQLKSCCNYHNHENVSDKLLEEKWIKVLKDRDIGFASEIVILLDYFDDLFIRKMKEVMNEEHIHRVSYSPLISNYYMNKLGYYENEPAHLFFASHLNLDKVEKFIKENKLAKGSDSGDNSYFGSPKYALQSAPCLKIYFSLENEIIEDNMTFLTIGNCFRNESKNTYLMERLLNFTMREFVFVGDPEFVLKSRDLSLESSVRFMKHLGIDGRVEEANDPFFISENQKSQFQIPSSIKNEVKATIPYKNDSISIASFDTHGTFFSKTFDFGFSDKRSTWSGCIGLGLERAVWSFLQQYGMEKKNWPEEVQKELRSHAFNK